jgi:hypothetical protein
MGIAPGGTAGGLLGRYRDYLLAERGLAASTTDRYLRLAAAFLAWLPGGEEGVAGLGAGQVVAYVMQECPRHGGARAKLIVTALRSLLRFLHADGHVGTALAGAVPAAARRRAVRLPVALKPAHIQRLLDGCVGISEEMTTSSFPGFPSPVGARPGHGQAQPGLLPCPLALAQGGPARPRPDPADHGPQAAVDGRRMDRGGTQPVPARFSGGHLACRLTSLKPGARPVLRRVSAGVVLVADRSQ